MMLSNYHTHTTFCDGVDSPEEMVLEAIRLGMSELGFSGHSHIPFDDSYCMSLEGTLQYKAVITELKQKYADKIKILLGIEQDIYSDTDTDGYDYVIGSAHHLFKNGEYISVDLSRAEQERIIAQLYGGDQYSFAEDYYRAVATVYEVTKCDIIGHFDLITKFNEAGDMYDTSHPRYRKAAMEALDALCGTNAAFEINTGAISRGYRKTPYPDGFILEELKQRCKKLVFSYDCHNKKHLLLGHDTYLKMTK